MVNDLFCSKRVFRTEAMGRHLPVAFLALAVAPSPEVVFAQVCEERLPFRLAQNMTLPPNAGGSPLKDSTAATGRRGWREPGHPVRCT